MEMNQNYYFILFLFLLILCIINDYVTDVVVTWSDVIDQLYCFCWPDVKPIKFCYIGSDVEPIIM